MAQRSGFKKNEQTMIVEGSVIKTIKSIVSQLIKKHRTNDPFEIASQKNITVLKAHLGETLGFFSSYKRSKFIHVNNVLDKPMQRFVCAHELGHAVLHPGINTPFLKAKTLFSVDRFEREANEFAVELLMPDSIIRDYSTIQEASAACEIPLDAAKLKLLYSGGRDDER